MFTPKGEGYTYENLHIFIIEEGCVHICTYPNSSRFHLSDASVIGRSIYGENWHYTTDFFYSNTLSEMCQEMQ